MKRKTKRTNKTATMIGVWVPTDLLARLDQAAEQQDLDRSKLIRRVLREKLSA
jgi:metal-responsive CopG/Arc/MetJ family transcriptional regulator